MFGMSSEEFWEESPQLYWAYRTFYLKKIEQENENKNYYCWLQGNFTYLATQLALANSFGKQKQEFPTYNEMFKNEVKEQAKELTPEEKKQRTNLIVQAEFNACARF